MYDQSVRLPHPVVLASQSPRRRELLRRLIDVYDVAVSDVDEDALTLPDPFETARSLALAKARAVFRLRPEALVIGGDTVVAFPGDEGWRQLAKPVDAEDAVRMLSTLAGRTHTVATGVALVWPGGELAEVETSQVRFRDLDEAEIRAYVATGEPMDKAGAYGLQGIGADFVAEVVGSRTNVIGLPLERLESMLCRLSEN